MQVNHNTYGIPQQIGSLKVKPMSWNDFKGVPPENNWFLAHIYWSINYQYTNPREGERPQVRTTVNVSSKSWVSSKEDQKLLKHQYGHYLIGCLCALAFQKKVNYQSTKNGNFAQECKEALQECLREYCKREKQYDCDTYHYLNEDQQEEWQKMIRLQFLSFYKYFQQKNAFTMSTVQKANNQGKQENRALSVKKVENMKKHQERGVSSNKRANKQSVLSTIADRKGTIRNQINLYKKIENTDKLPILEGVGRQAVKNQNNAF